MTKAIHGFLISAAVAAVLAGVGVSGVFAQRRPAAEPPAPLTNFQNVTKMKCIFSQQVTTLWKNGEPQLQTKATDLVQNFYEIDASGGTARATMAANGSDLVARASAFSLHFLEITSAGSLKATTVFNQESRPGKLKAVYAQHDYLRMSLPGYEAEPNVGQYYGECEVVP